MVAGNVKNMECMLHRCENCPGFQKLQSYVEQELERYDIDDVTYSQWDSIDRTSLCSISAPVDEFIELLVYQVDNLTAHSFTAKSQTQYLKKQKWQIDEETCIILLEFAENYHFVIQDEVLGYNWNNKQCTLHPLVVYYRDQNNLLHCVCLCFISDDLEHDTDFVNELQRCQY